MSTTLYIYTGASDLSCAAVTSASDLTPLAEAPMFALGDAEPLTVKFLSAANTYEAWSGAADHALSVSLGLLSSDGIDAYAIANAASFTPTAGPDGWSGRLSLNGQALIDAVASALGATPRARGGWFYLQVRVTDAAGEVETYALIRCFVTGRVSTPTQASPEDAEAAANSAEAAAASAAEAAASQAAAASSAATAANQATVAGGYATAAEASATAAAGSATEAAAESAAAAASATAAEASEQSAANNATDAESSMNAASASATAAGDAMSAASSSASNADAARIDAETARDAAQASAAAASGSASAAAGSASAASASATAASASASSASSSATTALNAIIGLYLGDIAGGSVPATASAAGRYYRINAAGTSQGKTWAIGDLAIYNGTSGSWGQIVGDIVQQGDVYARLGLRYALPYWQGDGATTNRRFQATGINLAGSDFTLASAWFQMPTSNPSANAIIFAVSGTNTSDPISSVNTLSALITTGGDLLFRAKTATAGEQRDLRFTGLRSTYSSQWCRLVAAFTGNSTTAPTVWLLTQTGGLTALTGGTETTGGTPPNWADAALVSTYLLQGYNMPAGPFIPGAIINRRWAQADVEAYVLSGRFSYADAAGGSVVASYTKSFDNDSTGWNASGTASKTDNAGYVTLGNLSSAFNTARVGAAIGTLGLSIGRRYRVGFEYRKAGGSGRIAIGTVGQGDSGNSDYVWSEVADTSGAWVSRVAYLIPGDVNGFGFFGGASTYDVRNLSITPSGVLTDPTNGVQPCYVADDASPNGVPWLVVGYSPVTESKEFRIPAKVDMSSTGNKQLLAGALFADPTKVALDTAEDTCAGSPTYSIGDGTTATRYTASVARTAGRLRHTLSNAFPADSAKTGLYANVTASHASSTAERILVRGHITE